MAQHYSNPIANDPHALPDVETFWHDCRDDAINPCPYAHCDDCATYECLFGWYWQSCFPGCLPDGEPNGPFATEAEAVSDAQSDAWQDDDSDAYEIAVGNVGIVLTTSDRDEAERVFADYVRQSKEGSGRVAGEPVIVIKGSELYEEYNPSVRDEQSQDGDL